MDHCVTKPRSGESYAVALCVVTKCACGCGQIVSASLKSWDLLGNPESSVARGTATRIIAHGTFETLQAFMRGDAGADGCVSRCEVDAAVSRMLPSLTEPDLTRDLDAALDTAKQLEQAALELQARTQLIADREAEVADAFADIEKDRRRLDADRDHLRTSRYVVGVAAGLLFIVAIVARFF